MQSIRAKAFALLAKRSYFKKELGRKLAEKGYPEEEINPLLEKLEERGWLNDDELAKRFIVRQKERGYGPKVIAMKLKQKMGNCDCIIEESKEEAKRLIQKKYHRDLPEKKDKVIRALLRRGFSYDTIKDLLEMETFSC